MTMKSKNENLLNGKLAELIDARAPDFGVEAETRRGGKQPDIFMTIGDLSVIIEAERYQTNAKKAQAIREADVRIPALASAAVALCYPENCHTENIGNGGFIWSVRTPQTMKTAARWDYGGVDELIGELRHIREYMGDPERLAAKLLESLEAATIMLPNTMKQTIAESVNLPPDKNGGYVNAAKRALLVVANAMMFHARLEEYFGIWHRQKKFNNGGKPLTVRQCADSANACTAFGKSWQLILEIDYRPIFMSARRIVAYAGINDAVKKVAEAALDIVADPASLRHDLLGGLFHRALDSAKYDGSFYTTPASAVLLAGLSVEGKDKDYSVIDPACGTGTLLMAAAEHYRDLCIKSGVNNSLHRRIVEKVIHGADINITATQMAATTLGMISPKTDFANINIHRIPFGIIDGEPSLGSLEYLPGGTPSLLTDAGKRIQVDSEKATAKHLGKYNLVIMNPPYTRADLRHNNMGEEAKKLMAAREKKVMASTAAHQSNNGGNFVMLADALLKQGGTMATVKPLVAATNSTGIEERKFIADNYNIEHIIVPHDPKRFWFSGGTAISEMMIVAKRRTKGGKPKAVKVVALRYNPDRPSAARVLARLIANGKESPDYELHEISPEQLAKGEWTAVQFLSPLLLRDFYKMRRGELFKTIALGEKEGCIIVSGKEITGNMDGVDSLPEGGYPALWRNDTSMVISMAAKPDRYAVAKKGKEAFSRRKWQESGRLKFPLKINTPSARACAAIVSRDAIGGWWESVKVAKWQEKPLCLFANSSFGILGILGVKNAHKLPRPELSKPYLTKLPVPVLTKKQAEKMSAAFDELSKQTLSPLPQMADDEVRVKIDHAVADALKIDREVIDHLRETLAAEPCISGKRAGEYKLTAS
ncbi:MAG: N-6 DNA methylase [Gammaproteobacteria bacterium]